MENNSACNETSIAARTRAGAAAAAVATAAADEATSQPTDSTAGTATAVVGGATVLQFANGAQKRPNAPLRAGTTVQLDLRNCAIKRIMSYRLGLTA